MKGHKIIQLKQVDNHNWIHIIVNEQEIFKCRIEDLEFGGDGQLDSLVIQIEKEITNAY